MHVIPLDLASAYVGGIALLEGKSGECIDLYGAGVYGSASEAVNGGWADDGGLCAAGAVVCAQDNTVTVSMVGLIRQCQDPVDVVDIIVHLPGEGGLAEALVCLVVPLENTGAADVQPVARLLPGVTFGQALCNGAGGGEVVGRVGGVDHDVGFGGGRRDDLGCVQVSVGKVNVVVRILVLDQLTAGFITDK